MSQGYCCALFHFQRYFSCFLISQLHLYCLKSRVPMNKEVNIYVQMSVWTSVLFCYRTKCRIVGCQKYMFICLTLCESVKMFSKMFV